MTRDDVQAWLDRYVAAWRSNEAADVEALFSSDASYRYRPYGGDEFAAIGRDAIVREWLDEKDPPDSWDARYETFAVEGDRAVAIGRTDYLSSGKSEARTYHNVFLLRFAPDGRCTEFTEYYMREEPT